ncbi:MAG: hypothetical protein HY903_08850 [Deltaproteobacteria bacterium]|nr:hypothetical protein [Deltaproteobacteria bacterium]
MANKKLESFKIADTQRPGVQKPKKGGDKPTTTQESQSVGFTRIEKILEANDAASVSENLSKLIASLEDLEKKSSTNKDKAAAKKAIVAVERAADLLDYLFQTKASMQAGG